MSQSRLPVLGGPAGTFVSRWEEVKAQRLPLYLEGNVTPQPTGRVQLPSCGRTRRQDAQLPLGTEMPTYQELPLLVYQVVRMLPSVSQTSAKFCGVKVKCLRIIL